MKLIIINGPNLNLLGKREPEIYGSKTFDAFFNELQSEFPQFKLDYFQSNIEGELIDKLHDVGFSYDGIVLNADLQPGSNAWDIVYLSSFSKRFNFRPTFNLSSRIIYRSTGTNNSYLENTTYKFGNELQAFINFSDQFVFLKTLTNPSISFKYRNAKQDKIGGFNLNNTGGDWVFIIPNFSINLTSNSPQKGSITSLLLYLLRAESVM